MDTKGKVVIYFGSWSVYRQGDGKFDVEDIDPHLCTHAIYAFVGINEDGTVRVMDPWNDIDKGAMKRFVNLKQINPRLKTLVGIGGWNEGSSKFSHVAGNQRLRQVFVENASKFLQEHRFDGMDLDWEYPCQRGGGSSDKENFSLLVREMREEFDKHDLILTAALGAGMNTVNLSYSIPPLSKYLHWIHVMTYDFHGSWEHTVGENSPLYPSSADKSEEAKSLCIDASIKNLIKLGAAPEKLVLGVGFYGRTFQLNSSSNTDIGSEAAGPGNPGPYTKTAGFLGYNEICVENWTNEWSDEQQVPYSYKGNQWVGFDNAKSLKIKVDYAKRMGLGGIMAWSVDTDDFKGKSGSAFPLLNAINTSL